MSEVYFMRDGVKYPVTVLSETSSPPTIEIHDPARQWHSEQFVVMFLGYLCGKLPDQKEFQIQKVLDVWRQFKMEMGK